MSAWIKMIPLEEATGQLKEMYDLALTPSGTVDNVMRAHSLNLAPTASVVALRLAWLRYRLKRRWRSRSWRVSFVDHII